MQNASISQTGCGESPPHSRILRFPRCLSRTAWNLPLSVIPVCHWLAVSCRGRGTKQKLLTNQGCTKAPIANIPVKKVLLA